MIRYTFRCSQNHEWEGDLTQRVCNDCGEVVSGPHSSSWTDTEGGTRVVTLIERCIPTLDRKIEIQNLAHRIGAITADKNVAYGSSFEQTQPFLSVLYPNGIAPGQFGNALLFARIFDKMARIVTDQDAFGENPWEDIAGYGLCGALMSRKNNREDR